jgi:hypothetical protein
MGTEQMRDMDAEIAAKADAASEVEGHGPRVVVASPPRPVVRGKSDEEAAAERTEAEVEGHADRLIAPPRPVVRDRPD